MRDVDFDEVTFAVPDETANDSSSVDDGSAQGVHDGALDAGLIGFGDFDGNGDDPLSQLRKNPTVRNLVTVTFTRSEFMERLGECGLSDPTGTYRMFDAEMDVDGLGALKPVDATFDLRDSRFSPSGSQEEPELSDAIFDHDTAQLFGCRDMSGLSIQRVDLLQRAVGEFHRIAQDSHLESVAKAKQAMDVINTIADPELTSLAPQVTSALIDGKDTPDFSFRLADELDAERIKARDLLFSGQVDQSVELAEAALGRMDRLFASNPGVPRYFNSYAERVIYNRMFATEGERTVLIPDNLFYAHMELADVLAQVKGVKAALPHLNAMVRYAPATRFPISSWRFNWRAPRIGIRPERLASTRCTSHLTVRMRRSPITDSLCGMDVRPLRHRGRRVHHERGDCPGRIAMLESELQELIGRAQSQCIPVPTDVPEAMHVLTQAGLPVWPNTQVASLVRKAARVCVDEGMFVPARTLSVAASRMDDEERDGATWCRCSS